MIHARHPRSTLIHTAVAVLVLYSAFLPVQAQQPAPDQAALIHSVLPSVVNIMVDKQISTSPDVSPTIKRFVGSGFIIDSSGLIMTNYHVVQDVIDIAVTLSDGTRLSGKVQAASRLADLALVKVDPPHPLQAVRWGNSDALEVGDQVFAAGDPFAIGLSISAGIVSGLNRDIQNSPYDDMIQTDATINHGNSGGPLFNMKGEVVGVDSAIISPTSGSSGLGFAIPASSARFVADQLRKYDWVHPGWIGVKVQTITPEIASTEGMRKPEGAIVAYVFSNSPAKKAGIAIGDLIMGVDGRPLHDERALLRDIAHSAEDSPVNLLINRNGAQREVTMTAEAWPRNQWDRLDAPIKAVTDEITVPPDLGLSLAALTPEQKVTLATQGEPDGVMVTKVAADTDVVRRGMVDGDVILRVQNTPVSTPAQVQAAINAVRTKKQEYVLMLVQPKNQQMPGPRWMTFLAGSQTADVGVSHTQNDGR